MKNKIRKYITNPFLSIILTLLWLVLNESISIGNILFGSFLSILLTNICKGFLLKPNNIQNPKKIIQFIGVVFYDIITSNIQVAKIVLGPIKNIHPGFVEVPVELTNEFALTIFTSIITLTPGTVSAGLSADKKILLLHTLNLESKEELIYEVKNRYEMPLMEIFQC